MIEEPLFYLRGRTIFQRPIHYKDKDGNIIGSTMGFAVCEVSKWVNPQVVLETFNNSKSAQP
jgi:hypothetical protein